MEYSNPSKKTVCELEDELADVYRKYFAPYKGQNCTGAAGLEFIRYNGGEIRRTNDVCFTFGKMVEKFASDDSYRLHLVAKEYLTVDPAFRIEVLA